jgi:hypothetical protein
MARLAAKMVVEILQDRAVVMEWLAALSPGKIRMLISAPFYPLLRLDKLFSEAQDSTDKDVTPGKHV